MTSRMTVHPLANGGVVPEENARTLTATSGRKAVNISACSNMPSFYGVKHKAYGVCSFLAHSTRFTAFTTLLTVYVLFGDDLRLLATQKPQDPVFDVLTIASLILFLIEIFAQSVAKDDYLMSFFMVLDTISTVTLIFDVSTVASSLSAQNEEGEGGKVDGSMARASRASRAGTRAARVVRIIRLIRLFRIVKLYKASLNRSKPGSSGAPEQEEDDEDGTRGLSEQSRVGKKLSEKTTKKVIMIVLGMMAATPLFVFGTLHESDPQSKQMGSDLFMSNYVAWRELKAASSDPENDPYVKLARESFEDSFLYYIYVHNPKASKDACGDRICGASYTNKVMWIGGTQEIAKDFHITAIDPSTWNDRFSPQGDEDTQWIYALGTLPLVVRQSLSQPFDIHCKLLNSNITGISLRKDEDYPVICPGDLRFMEQLLIVGGHKSGKDEYIILMYFDLRETSKFSAFLNICTTLFICVILWWGAMAFSKVSDTLVLHPLERMIERVEIIKNNPLEALYASYDEGSVREKRGPVTDFNDGPFWKNNRFYIWVANRRARSPRKKKENPMETVILEKTIIKIGSLMALGFGEAGMEIISQNMHGGTSSTVNAMIPGRKIHGIFAYCDIRSFLDATEVLQDQIMVFVNKISGVIHPTCDEFLGAPNKNIGDSFLIVWRFEPWYDENLVKKVADLALMSFVKIVSGINVNQDLRAYSKHKELLRRIPNFSVRISFGVHVGWAIEGAIGSEFKIDASYLSPNVNMASTLEALTQNYGLIILFTSTFVDLLSLAMSSVCRIIDHVLVRGYKGSVRLHTIDLDTSSLMERTGATTKRQSMHHNAVSSEERRCSKMAKLDSSYTVYDEFNADRNIKIMRHKYTTHPGFMEKFMMAVLNYESGEWEVARVFLEFTQNYLPGAADGPSVNLLNFLKLHDYIAPKDWPGYRELDRP